MVELFPDRLTQIRAFGIIDFIVQAGTLFSQLFLTGCLAERLGGGAHASGDRAAADMHRLD